VTCCAAVGFSEAICWSIASISSSERADHSSRFFALGTIGPLCVDRGPQMFSGYCAAGVQVCLSFCNGVFFPFHVIEPIFERGFDDGFRIDMGNCRDFL